MASSPENEKYVRLLARLDFTGWRGLRVETERGQLAFDVVTVVVACPMAGAWPRRSAALRDSVSANNRQGLHLPYPNRTKGEL